MKLITFQYQEEELIGIVQENEVAPLREFATMEALIRAGLPEALPEERIPLSQVKLLAPIPRPSQDVICLGMNFADHSKEAARFSDTMKRENYAVYFSKRVNEAVADKGEVDSHPEVTSQLDYEAEIAFVIGKDAYQVPREKVKDYIFGYTIINDVSAREAQTLHKQFYFGKSLDTFTPMGPCLVTSDEFSFPPEINIRCYVNEELRQDGNTRQWIFGIEDVVSELSAGMTLKAGTIVAMGTPAGVGMGFTPPRFLKKQDIVHCEADGIGSLTNTIK